MVAHSSMLAWRIPLDRGTWQATLHEVAESDTTERLNTAQKFVLKLASRHCFIYFIRKLISHLIFGISLYALWY